MNALVTFILYCCIPYNLLLNYVKNLHKLLFMKDMNGIHIFCLLQ